MALEILASTGAGDVLHTGTKAIALNNVSQCRDTLAFIAR